MDDGIRLHLICQALAELSIHIAASGDHDIVIFAKQIQRFDGAVRDLIICMVQQCHVHVKADDSLHKQLSVFLL